MSAVSRFTVIQLRECVDFIEGTQTKRSSLAAYDQENDSLYTRCLMDTANSNNNNKKKKKKNDTSTFSCIFLVVSSTLLCDRVGDGKCALQLLLKFTRLVANMLDVHTSIGTHPVWRNETGSPLPLLLLLHVIIAELWDAAHNLLVSMPLSLLE